MDILDPNHCFLKLSQNPPHFQIFYQENSESKPYLLPDYDAVLPRFKHNEYANGMFSLTTF